MKRNSTGTSIVLLVVTMLCAFTSCSNMDDYSEYESASTRECMSPLTRAVADSMTVADFRRCYGVGYSYDGIWGEPCNPRDVHSRVLDLEAMRTWEKEESWHLPLFFSNKTSEAEIRCQVAYNKSDMTHKTVFHADAEANLMVFKGNTVANIQAWETGTANNFFCQSTYELPSLELELNSTDIAALVSREGRTDLLSPNFREAIDWLDKHRDVATIDSFLTYYGSHVVNRARLGASLTLTMNMERDSLTDVYTKEAFGEAVIKGILKTKSESKEYEKQLNMLNSASCDVTIKGGDLSKIPTSFLHFNFGERPNLSSFVSEWAGSVNYNLKDYMSCNLEMTDMEVKPIWYFIPNKEVAQLIKRHIESTGEELNAYSGYQNFANVSFQIPQTVTCTMGDEKMSFNSPEVINVIAQGRYVATVCREQIDLPDKSNVNVQVIYPIYNQQVNLSSGFCVYDKRAYTVCWLANGKLKVELDSLSTPSDDGTVFLTYGVPGVVKYANVKYTQGHPVIGYEWPKAIKIDGSIDKNRPYYLVYKKANAFLLRNKDGSEQLGELGSLPNWTLMGGRMVRNKDYCYYWNPNEINY